MRGSTSGDRSPSRMAPVIDIYCEHVLPPAGARVRPGPLYAYDLETLSARLTAAGFTDVAERPFDPARDSRPGNALRGRTETVRVSVTLRRLRRPQPLRFYAWRAHGRSAAGRAIFRLDGDRQAPRDLRGPREGPGYHGRR